MTIAERAQCTWGLRSSFEKKLASRDSQDWAKPIPSEVDALTHLTCKLEDWCSLSTMSLAFHILMHDKKRLFVAIASISFASILMFQQQGYKHALYDSSSEIIRLIDGDLIIFSEARFAVSAEQRFPKSSLEQVAGTPGVAGVIPVYVESTVSRFRSTRSVRDQQGRVGEGHRARPIRVIGIPVAEQPFRFGVSASELEKLRAPRTAFIDRLSKPQYGVDLGQEAKDMVQPAELADRSINVVGLFSLGQDFVFDGNLLMSQENFADYFSYRASDPLSIVDLGVVKLESGSDLHEVKQRLTRVLPAGTSILTRDEYVRRESDFWATSTPIGMIFTVGAVMGFVVGVIICYQILVDDISNQIGEYATLKAMGYSNGFLFRVVVSQGGMLALASFLPSLLVTLGAFQTTYSIIGLRMELTTVRALSVFALTFSMCIFSSILAIRRLITADPASLFR